MLNPLKRLFHKDEPKVQTHAELMAERIKNAPDPQIQLLKELAPFLGDVKRVESVGDGKAEFLPDMTEDEVLQYERTERAGWKDFKLPWQK